MWIPSYSYRQLQEEDNRQRVNVIDIVYRVDLEVYDLI